MTPQQHNQLLWEIGSTLVEASAEQASAVTVDSFERVSQSLSVESIGWWHTDLTAGTTVLRDVWEPEGTILPQAVASPRVADPSIADRLLDNDGVAVFPVQAFFAETDIPPSWREGSVLVVLIEFDGGQADTLGVYRRTATWTDDDVQFFQNFALTLRQFLMRIETDEYHKWRIELGRFTSEMQRLLGDASVETAAVVADEVVQRVWERLEARSVAIFEVGERLNSIHQAGRAIEPVWFDLDVNNLPFDMRAKEPEIIVLNVAELARNAFGSAIDGIDFGDRQVTIVAIGVADGPARSFLTSHDDRVWNADERVALVGIGRSFGEMLARTDAERWSRLRLQIQEEVAATLTTLLHGSADDIETLVADALGGVARSFDASLSAIIDSSDAAPGTCGRAVALWQVGTSAIELGGWVRYPEPWVNEAILAGETVITSIEMPSTEITGDIDSDATWTLVCTPLRGWLEGPTSVGILLPGDQTPWGPTVVELLATFGHLLAQLRIRLNLERDVDWRKRAHDFIQLSASTLSTMGDAGFDTKLDLVLTSGADLLGAGQIELWSFELESGRHFLRSAPLRPEAGGNDSPVEALLEAAHTNETLNQDGFVFLPLRREGFVSVLTAGPFDSEAAEHAIPVLEHFLVVLDRAERRATAERDARTAFDESPIGILLCDSELRTITCNTAYASFLGHATSNDVAAVGTDETLTTAVQESGAGTYELPFTHADGREVWGLAHATPIERAVTRQQTWLVHIEDITERRRHEEFLRHQATTDELTGLANRRVLTSRMSEIIDSESAPAVLLLDLDRFKTVNDSLGHDRGDELLVVIADRIRLAVRPGDLVIRLGGDEFAILLESPSTTADAVTVADRLIELLDAPLILAGQPVYPTASIGIAQLELPTTVSDVLRAADTAMYKAKAAGGSGHATFDQQMQGKANERLQVEAGLRHALGNAELLVHYQPEVALDSGRFLGAEALIRWDHPLRGLIQARRFIPVAEESGLLANIGAFVLGQACIEAASWTDPNTVVRVNLSTSQLRQPDLLSVVREALDAAGLPPHRLCIEVTEATMTDAEDRAERVLTDLRSLGVGIALDDFGTGFSSLAYLKRFPVDTVKIDRSFVHGLDGPKPDDAFVRSIVSLAEALNLEVVAEGVESQAQADALLRLGCARAQGFFYARPMPVDELATRFASAAQ